MLHLADLKPPLWGRVCSGSVASAYDPKRTRQYCEMKAQRFAEGKNSCSPAGLKAAILACPSGEAIQSINSFAPL